MVRSPAVILYDANGVAMAVANGVAIPASTRGVLAAGTDGTNARHLRATIGGLLLNVARSLPEAVREELTGLSFWASGHRHGYATTSSTAFIAVRGTAYIESASANLEVVSSSASDASAGTGTRTLKVIYYRSDQSGPYETTITMNGTTAVNLGDVLAQHVEHMESVTIGSNGTNVGTITIRAAGGGASIGTIAVGDGQTFWSHHFVAAGRKCMVKGFVAGVTGNGCRAFLRCVPVGTPNGFTQQEGPSYRHQSGASSLFHEFPVPIRIDGFARVEQVVRADSATAMSVFGGFSFYEV